MRSREDGYNPDVLAALESGVLDGAAASDDDGTDSELHELRVEDLEVGMTTCEDVYAENGVLLLPKGAQVTYAVTVRLRNFSERSGVVEPLRMRVPALAAQR